MKRIIKKGLVLSSIYFVFVVGLLLASARFQALDEVSNNTYDTLVTIK